MSDAINNPTQGKIPETAGLLSLAVIFISLLVLIGYIFHINVLRRLDLDTVAMNPISAILFMLTGTSLWLIRNKDKHTLGIVFFSRLFSSLVTIVSAIKILSLFSNFHFHFEDVFFRDQLFEPSIGDLSRMAPNEALNFTLAGLAIFIINLNVKNKVKIFQFLGIIISLISVLGFYGYVYGVKQLLEIADFRPMPILSSISFVLLSLSILFLRPYEGTMAIIVGDSTTEVIYLRFFAFFIPLLFGWIKLKGERAGLYNNAFGTALFAMISYFMSMFLIGRQSVIQNRLRKLREAAHKIIREDAKRLKSILNNSSNPIYMKNMEGKFTMVNKQFMQYYGVHEKEVIGKTASEVFPGRRGTVMDQADFQVILSGITYAKEETVKIGSFTFYFNSVKFPLQDTKGKIYAVCNISTDITELKNYQDKTGEQKKMLETIIENIGEGVVVSDKKGNYIAFNKLAGKILGKGKQNISVEEWSTNYHIYKEDKKTIFPYKELPLYLAIKGEESEEVEMFIKNPEFKKGREISVTARPIKEEDEVIAGVAVFRDVTRRRKLQKDIAENERRLKEILTTIGEGVVVSDTKGKFLLFNKKAEHILGQGLKQMDPAEWTTYYNLYYPNTEKVYDIEDLPLMKAINGHITENHEIDIRIPGEEIKTILLSARPIRNEEGEITGAVADFKDITELRNLETVLDKLRVKYEHLLKLSKLKN